MTLQAMWAIDLTHTSHTRAQTGIQQVCRALLRELPSSEARPLIHDPYAQAWRDPDPSERKNLFENDALPPGGKRSSHWSWGQKLRGYLNRLKDSPAMGQAFTGVFCPEIFSPVRADALFRDPWATWLPKVALFHDAIAVKHPQWCPEKTVASFPAYMECLSWFDHVICVSRSSERDLMEYWKSRDIEPAPTSVIPLGLPGSFSVARASAGDETTQDMPTVLMVGTLEARKNHPALLQACERLWGKGLVFRLDLAGMLNKETGNEVARLVRELSKKGRMVNWQGPVTSSRLQELYASADVFAYPSLYEGFGIPVLEALAHGLPVLTTRHGALDELVDGGGCLACDGSVEEIETGLGRLLEDAGLRRDLARQARERPLRTMREAAAEMLSLLHQTGSIPKS